MRRTPTTDLLERVRDEAKHQRAEMGHPPWTWFRWMKLEEAAEQLLEAHRHTRLVTLDGQEVVPDVIPVNLP